MRLCLMFCLLAGVIALGNGKGIGNGKPPCTGKSKNHDTECVNGKCITRDGRPYCDCDDGWEGETCEVDVDECDDGPCDDKATCYNTDGSFTCECNDGYTGDGFMCTAKCLKVEEFGPVDAEEPSEGPPVVGGGC